MSIQAAEVAALRQSLRRMEGGVTDLRAVHAEAAGVVAKQAHTLVPRRSGDLDRTIRSSGQIRQGVVRAGRAGLPYGGVIHFGWPRHRIAPNPFLYEAADQRGEEVRRRYEVAVEKLARDAGIPLT